MHPRLKLPEFEQTLAASRVAKHMYDRQLQWWVQSLLQLRSEAKATQRNVAHEPLPFQHSGEQRAA